jgi:hypothetical protein
MTDAAALVRRLKTAGSDLPKDLAEQIVARRAETTPLLLEMLSAHSAPPENAPADGACEECGVQHDDLEYARLHAVDLLAQIGDPRAIDAMLAVLASAPGGESIHDKVVEGLPHFGPVAIDAILRALARAPKNSDTAEAMCCVLAALGVRDPRILQALLDLLKVRTREAAVYLAEYGDPAACPALLAVLCAADRDGAFPGAEMEWRDVIDAYTSLGGDLPEEMRRHVDAGGP